MYDDLIHWMGDPFLFSSALCVGIGVVSVGLGLAVVVKEAWPFVGRALKWVADAIQRRRWNREQARHLREVKRTLRYRETYENWPG